MARLFIRRAGPPAAAWPPQDAEEDALAAAGTVVTCCDGEVRWEADASRRVLTSLVCVDSFARGNSGGFAASNAARLPWHVAL